jgi:iron complex transport system substrate-binding protein
MTLFAVVLLLAAGVAPVGAVAGDDTVESTGAVGAQADCSFPVTETDATETEVTVEQKPERIVTLAPSAAQTMWEIGGQSQVVGVSQHATYLEGAESLTNISAAGESYVNVEKVVSTEADLVLAPDVIPNETVQQLRDAGQTVYKFEAAESVSDIYGKVELAGKLTGNCEAASQTVSRMQDRISTVREAVESSDSPRVFVSIGGGWTAGNGTFISNMVELAGGTNIASEANVSGSQQLSEEVIVEQDPEWIIQIGAYGVYPETEAYNGTYAVQNDQVFTVSNENISQPAPRVVNAIVTMAEAFHPEVYAEANSTTTTEGAMQEATTTTNDDDSAGSVPGFGVTAALAALAGAAMLARRP